ncbi:hypothetical protein GLOTRDRAFT_134588 [Gloeophyllum trabeum ATCC 11539]|uniref:Uncharacterized protein n=1 Tax=Gloeophyllum trabeum (strain ATCC 11539 / FP-39264 / Madison 617) TaxID=670483 RepID=S7PR04_GLOTA|nr:uncharacterized protein GLOTRDRAFT_134588 [Gloeophyllum trabeum ATCC 11539]EPQ49807.1 hypothetical protein GLOTRDRAFT_134588 [Gloeophyllum trabeum ATCC 11539]
MASGVFIPADYDEVPVMSESLTPPPPSPAVSEAELDSGAVAPSNPGSPLSSPPVSDAPLPAPNAPVPAPHAPPPPPAGNAPPPALRRSRRHKREMPVVIRRSRDNTPEDEVTPPVDPAPVVPTAGTVDPPPGVARPPHVRKEPPAPVRSKVIKPQRKNVNKAHYEKSVAIANAHKQKRVQQAEVIDAIQQDKQIPTFSKSFQGASAKDERAAAIQYEYDTRLLYCAKTRRGICENCPQSVAPTSTCAAGRTIILWRPQPTSQADGSQPSVQFTCIHWDCLSVDARKRFYLAPVRRRERRLGEEMKTNNLQNLDVSKLRPADLRYVLDDIRDCHDGCGQQARSLAREETKKLLTAKKLTIDKHRAEYRKTRSEGQKIKMGATKTAKSGGLAAKHRLKWEKRQKAKEKNGKGKGKDQGEDEFMEVDDVDKGEGSSKRKEAEEEPSTEESDDEPMQGGRESSDNDYVPEF